MTSFLLTNLITGAAIFALSLCLCLATGRKTSAAIRHMILSFGFLAVLGSPAICLLIMQSTPVRDMRTRLVLLVTPDSARAEKKLQEAHGRRIPFDHVAAKLWLSGAAVLLIRVLIGTRSRTNRTFIPEATLRARDLARSLGIRRSVKVEESDRIRIPETRGEFTPVIVFPPDARNWDQARIDFVLTHELVHILRHDWAAGVLAEIVAALHWFNPLAWYSLRLLHLERELACDDAVLDRGSEPADYAGRLIEFASSAGCRAQAGSIAMAHVSSLEKRVCSILNPELKRGGLTMKSKALAGTLAAIVVVFLSVLQAPAQSGGAVVFGAVQDSSGAYVADAVVLVRNSASRKRDMTHTDVSGQFRFEGLAEGDYQLQASKPGFQLYLQNDVQVRAGTAQQIPIGLRLGGINETVNVNGTGTASANSSATPKRLRIGGNVEAAKLVKKVAPIYPADLKEQRLQGTVLLDAVIGRDGRVANLEVANTLVNPGFVQVTLEAVRQWEYEPTFLNGEPVEVATSIAVNFTLLP